MAAGGHESDKFTREKGKHKKEMKKSRCLWAPMLHGELGTEMTGHARGKETFARPWKGLFWAKPVACLLSSLVGLLGPR